MYNYFKTLWKHAGESTSSEINRSTGFSLRDMVRNAEKEYKQTFI